MWGILSASVAGIEMEIAALTSDSFRQYLIDLPFVEIYRNIAGLLAMYAVSGMAGWVSVWFLCRGGGKKGEAFFKRNTVTIWGAGVLAVYGSWAVRKFFWVRGSLNGFEFFLALVFVTSCAVFLGNALQKYSPSPLARTAAWMLVGISLLLPPLARFPQAKPLSREGLSNVILLSVDTLRPDRLGCYGSKRTLTPNIDRIARHGLLFRNAYTPIPLTGPSFSSLLTGLYPKTHGSRQNLTFMDSQAETLAEVFQGVGYQTAAFVSGYPLKREFCSLAKGFGLYQDRFSFFDGFKLLRFLERFGLVELQLERRAGGVSSLAIPWMARNKDRPFFVWIHYYDPHVPYRPPLSVGADPILRDLERRQRHLWGKKKEEIPPHSLEAMRALYDGEVAYVDEDIGRTLSFLKTVRLQEKTLIVFVSDHGEGMDHDYYFDHGDRLYESCIRIPVILSYPGMIPEGSVSEEVIQSVDLFPTLLSLLKFSRATLHEGRRVWPPEGSLKRPPRPIYAELSRRKGYPTLGDLWAFREGPWKLIYSPEGSPPELYHLEEDPGETVNLSLKEPERVLEMTEALLRWMGEKKEVQPPEVRGLAREKLKSLGYLQ